MPHTEQSLSQWFEDQGFSERQIQIGLLVCEGITNQKIERRLRISSHTLNYHLTRMFKAVRVTNRYEFVVVAWKACPFHHRWHLIQRDRGSPGGEGSSLPPGRENVR